MGVGHPVLNSEKIHMHMVHFFIIFVSVSGLRWFLFVSWSFPCALFFFSASLLCLSGKKNKKRKADKRKEKKIKEKKRTNGGRM